MIHDPLEIPPKQTNGNHRMPLPSTLFQDIRSTVNMRNAPRTTQSQTVQEDRWGDQCRNQGRREKVRRLSHTPRHGAGTVDVWGLETRFTQVLSPLFRGALSPYLASCCQQKV